MLRKRSDTPSTLQATTSGPTAPVPKDPQPSVDRIDELARRILKGDILLPKFQRGLVWDKEQILTLLDSVARGYPIGSILLWQSRQELRSENCIAELDIELPRPDYPVNYLLDGQQRLSAICGAMFWDGDDPKSRWNIIYDLRTQKLSHLDSLEDPPLHQIRFNKLSDPTVFFKHVASLDTLTSADKDILKQRADALFSRFKDYKIATVTLGDMSIQDVAPVFERINSTGTRLTIVDLMRAATWSPDFDLVDAIDSLLVTLQDKEFGGIDRRIVLRNISASAGGGFSAESIDQLRNYALPEKVEALKDAIAKTEEAYKRTVDFLSTEIGINNANVIPYSNQITVLAEIFRRVPTPNSKQHKAIVEWFWKTSLSGYFSGWNTGMMATDLATIKEFANGQKDRLTFQPRRDDTPDVWLNRQFRSNNAHTKLFAIILAHNEPVNLLTGKKIDTSLALSWDNAKEFHHFFPQAFLKNKKEPVQRINCLANIIMLTSASNKDILNKAPSAYLQDVAEAAGGSLNDWLKSNIISEQAYEAALRDDFDGFLTYRAEAINLAVKQKIEA